MVALAPLEWSDDELVPISALEHWSYCPRQCALIHLEQTYDENLYTLRGNRAHRQADEAEVCLGYGQRVQKSVFECRVTEAQLEELEDRLSREMDERVDRLRVYRLAGPRDRHVRVFGVAPPNDFREPLIV